MLYGLGGMAVCFTLLTSMFCFKVTLNITVFCTNYYYYVIDVYAQEGFFSNPETTPTVTAPGVLLVISSLGITIFYALGPGKQVLSSIT